MEYVSKEIIYYYYYYYYYYYNYHYSTHCNTEYEDMKHELWMKDENRRKILAVSMQPKQLRKESLKTVTLPKYGHGVLNIHRP